MDRTKINALMDQASGGDDSAFGEMSAAVQDELFRLALSLGLQGEDAVEATQEVLLRAYRGRKGWKRGSDALAWLCGITVNVAREWRRRENRNAVWLKEHRNDAAAHAGNASPDGSLDSDTLENLAAALADLPPRQREAIACRYLRRMSIRQTAQAMGCAEGTVKSTVAAALERLQAVLEAGHESR